MWRTQSASLNPPPRSRPSRIHQVSGGGHAPLRVGRVENEPLAAPATTGLEEGLALAGVDPRQELAHARGQAQLGLFQGRAAPWTRPAPTPMRGHNAAMRTRGTRATP